MGRPAHLTVAIVMSLMLVLAMATSAGAEGSGAWGSKPARLRVGSTLIFQQEAVIPQCYVLTLLKRHSFSAVSPHDPGFSGTYRVSDKRTVVTLMIPNVTWTGVWEAFNQLNWFGYASTGPGFFLGPATPESAC
jgi:hypothetical protein